MTDTTILFWVASRGHHADVGGVAPGSMSPLATHIEEEGVYIDNFKIVDRGRFREEETRDLLTGARYPARNPLQNLNDLKAQIASNEKGVAELKSMIGYFGLDVVEAYMGHVQDNAAESVRRVLDRLADSSFDYEMDQGCRIRVRITVDKALREATVDFTGTSEQRPDNFNAPAPVTRAAVLYVFRVMVEDEIPMNAGLPAADPHHRARRLDAVAALSGRGRGRQCRGQPGRDQLPVRRARRHGGLAGHDEQPDLRQRRLSVLRDDLLRLAGRTGLRRHRRRARAHDQFPPHRSGDPRDALPGRAWRISTCGGAEAGRDGGRPAPAPAARSASASAWIAPSCPRIAACRRSASPAAQPGEVGRTLVRRGDGRVEELKGCDQTVLEAGEAVTVITPTGGGYGPA